MAQKLEASTERPLQSFSFKDFLATNTTNARIATPEQAFYDLENAQPIGAANLHSINDISAALHDFAGDTVYYDADVNISGTEYLLVATTNGKLFAYNVGTQAVTQINGAATLGGSATRITQYQNTQALIIDSSGYYNWNGTGNIVSIGGVTAAPSNGVAIAVYQNRVWVAQGRVLFFSAPASFTDFQTTSGGGSTTLVDSTLRSTVQQLLSANGYLYVFGTSSINAISDLYIPTGASPPTPNFTNLNLTAIVGTDQPYSLMLYGRLVLFANRYGVWSLYGTTVTQISSPDPNNQYQSAIDGTWQYVNFTQAISGAQCISNNLLCGGFLIQRANDPVFGSNTVIAMYQGNAAGGRWWFANWGSITRVTTSYVNNAPAMFGYIGNKLYQLFALTSTAPPATIMTALWDFGDPITQKQVLRAGVSIIASGGTGLTGTLDTPFGSQAIPFQLVGQVQWVNNLSTPVQWVNNVSANITWVAGGTVQTYWAQAPQGYAKYVGMTVKTTQGMIFELNAFLMDYKWAARWSGN
jgi:hypothetical protein